MKYKCSYVYQLFKKKNLEKTAEERRLAALHMHGNYFCQYKAILLQRERECDLTINVPLYQEIVLPFFTVKRGQFISVALIISGANKILRKVWEAFIIQRDRIIVKSITNPPKTKKHLMHNLRMLNFQLVNKLAIELIKIWLV